MDAPTDLKQGDEGPEVEHVQELLRRVGHRNVLRNARFGSDVSLAVIEFQTKAGLQPTGVVDARTMRALAEAAAQPEDEASREEAASGFQANPPARAKSAAASDDSGQEAYREGKPLYRAPDEQQPGPPARAVPTRPYLRVLSDAALEADDPRDRLGFRAYADALAGLIGNPEIATPLTLAINAPWGAGKTTLARMIQRRLASEDIPAAGGDYPHVICEFNAWMHDDAPNLTSAFAAEVARAANARRHPLLRILRPAPGSMQAPMERLSLRLLYGVAYLAGLAGLALVLRNNPSYFDWLTDIFKSILAATRTSEDTGKIVGTGVTGVVGIVLFLLRNVPTVGAAVSAFVKNPESSASLGDLTRVREQLGSLIRQGTPRGSRFVIFVDDLERCRPPRSVELLEVVNQLICHEGVVTVIMADMPAVAACADIKYKDLAQSYRPAGGTPRSDEPRDHGFGRLYLQKIIQLQFDIPAHSPARLRALIQNLAEEQSAPAVRESSAGLERESSPQSRDSARSRLVGFLMTGRPGAWAIVVGVVGVVLTLIGSFPAPHAPRFLVWPGTVLLLVVLWPRLTEWSLRRFRRLRTRRARAVIGTILKSQGENRTALAESLETLVPDPELRQALIEQQRILERINDRALLEDAYEEVFPFLPQLPRNAKRVINHLRVQLYVADERGLFAPGSPLTPRHVGKWVALRERWPELAHAISAEPGILGTLEEAAGDATAFRTQLESLVPECGFDKDMPRFFGSTRTRLKEIVRQMIYFTPGPAAR